MQLTLLKGKIHRATVTHSELNYEGSVAIDETCCARPASANPSRCTWDVNNGARFSPMRSAPTPAAASSRSTAVPRARWPSVTHHHRRLCLDDRSRGRRVRAEAGLRRRRNAITRTSDTLPEQPHDIEHGFASLQAHARACGLRTADLLAREPGRSPIWPCDAARCT
jgi:hypothetical protein